MILSMRGGQAAVLLAIAVAWGCGSAPSGQNDNDDTTESGGRATTTGGFPSGGSPDPGRVDPRGGAPGGSSATGGEPEADAGAWSGEAGMESGTFDVRTGGAATTGGAANGAASGAPPGPLVVVGSAGVGATIDLGSGGASGGAAGSGGTVDLGSGGNAGTPSTGGVLGTGGWGPLHEGSTTKVDLLLTIDNSISMADKQALLKLAVPQLLRRLISPDPEAGYDPVLDLHVGVLSSSLGGHGGILCSPDYDVYNETQNDHGQLIAPLRGLASFEDRGFLKFDPSGDAPGAITDREQLLAAFADIVTATGEEGCGYEATLESWYRFLADPQPPLEVVRDGNASVAQGIDQTVLEQRAQFLRPDSLLVVLMLSDENDCSLRDDGLSWMVSEPTTRLPRSTAACAEDPNDPCCRSCQLQEVEPPPGCTALTDDESCQLGSYSVVEDPSNLRCFEQKRRFGLDFLYPIDRYVRVLTTPTVLGRTCATDDDCPSNHPAQEAGRCVEQKCEYRNPIYSLNPNYPDALPRRPDMAYLAALVGVPWQDIATPETLDDPDQLEYLTGAELADRWATILDTDPYMVEAIDPRSGTNPVTGIPIAPETAPGGTSPINGHEVVPDYDRNDLQYACTFPLAEPRDCSTYSGGCDCRPHNVDEYPVNPLCQADGSTTATAIQRSAKAYPGRRYLEVLQGVGSQAIIGSVCPKFADPADVNLPSFGYTPIVNELIERMAAGLE